MSVTFFVRNAIALSGMKCVREESGIVLNGGKRAEILFLPDGARVIDCYRYNREERFQISSYIYEKWYEDGFHERSAQSLESELALHAFSYRLGIAKENSKDADLDIKGDDRWYVFAGYSLIEVLGL